MSKPEFCAPLDGSQASATAPKVSLVGLCLKDAVSSTAPLGSPDVSERQRDSKTTIPAITVGVPKRDADATRELPKPIITTDEGVNAVGVKTSGDQPTRTIEGGNILAGMRRAIDSTNNALGRRGNGEGSVKNGIWSAVESLASLKRESGTTTGDLNKPDARAVIKAALSGTDASKLVTNVRDRSDAPDPRKVHIERLAATLGPLLTENDEAVFAREQRSMHIPEDAKRQVERMRGIERAFQQAYGMGHDRLSQVHNPEEALIAATNQILRDSRSPYVLVPCESNVQSHTDNSHQFRGFRLVNINDGTTSEHFDVQIENNRFQEIANRVNQNILRESSFGDDRAKETLRSEVREIFKQYGYEGVYNLTRRLYHPNLNVTIIHTPRTSTSDRPDQRTHSGTLGGLALTRIAGGSPDQPNDVLWVR